MTDGFSISLRFLALRTADLDRSREFYQNLLGLNVCGESPASFSNSLWAMPLCASTCLMARNRRPRYSPSEGLSHSVNAWRMPEFRW
jgi:catechol 2,3-dioxygenase-like lactoylglutathione lyase family enzyme